MESENKSSNPLSYESHFEATDHESAEHNFLLTQQSPG